MSAGPPGIDFIHQRIDRRLTSGCVRAGPSFRTETRTDRPLRLVPKLVNRPIDNHCTRRFSDGVPRAQDLGGPRIVALERRRRGERDQGTSAWVPC